MRTGILSTPPVVLAAALASACAGVEAPVELPEPGAAPGAATTVEWARIEPAKPLTNDVLRVEARAHGASELTCDWRVNGQPLDTSSCVLDGGSAFDKGDRVEVTVLAQGDAAPAMPVVLEPVVVGNSPPQAADLELDPLEPLAAVDDLRCEVTPGLDEDGDPLDVELTWFVDGMPWTGPTLTLVQPNDTIPAQVLSNGTEWTCRVEVDDGTDFGPLAEVSTDALPSPPFGEELLTDGSFESTAQNWSHGQRTCEVIRPEQIGLDEIDGEHALFGGQAPESCSVHQRLDLFELGFPLELVDAGELAVDAEIWLAGHLPAGALDDQSWLRVRYLDELDRPLGSLSTLIGGDEDWIHRQAQGLLPRGTRVLQVEVVAEYVRGSRNDAMADAVSVRLERVERELPLVSKLPLLQDYRQDAMRLIWETDRNLARHHVEWGPAGEEPVELQPVVDTIHIDDTHFVHRATIHGLEAGTEYSYRVRGGENLTDTWTFRTAPEETEPVRVAWIADNQNRPDTFRGLLSLISDHEPDLMVAPGDIVEDGYLIDDWEEQWFGPLADGAFGQTTPVLSARGNHERHHAYTLAYTALPGHGNWYSFRYGPVFFVVLDTELGVMGTVSAEERTRHDLGDLAAEQAEFLREALQSEAATSAAWQVVTFHNPPYANSRHDEMQDGSANARDHWVEVFESEGVDLVVGAHYHSYQRGEQNGVHYVVTGGGGGSLDDRVADNYDIFDVIEQVHHYDIMDADEERLLWQSWDAEDQLVDQFVLER